MKQAGFGGEGPLPHLASNCLRRLPVVVPIFQAAVKELFPFRSRHPDAPGPRGREDPLYRAGRPGKVVPNNTHFDTTRANVEFTGAEAVDLVIPEGRDPAALHPFKGNMDVAALDALLAAARADDVPLVFVTITNNSGGGQPVSPREPPRACARSATSTGSRSSWTLAASRRTPGSSASARPGQGDRDVADIVREMASLADGMTMSAKKDPLGNIGGWLA